MEAISRSCLPAAAARTKRLRKATCCGVLGAASHRTTCSRSSAAKLTSGLILAMRTHISYWPQYVYLFMIHTTSEPPRDGTGETGRQAVHRLGRAGRSPGVLERGRGSAANRPCANWSRCEWPHRRISFAVARPLGRAETQGIGYERDLGIRALAHHPSCIWPPPGHTPRQWRPYSRRAGK